MTFALAGVEEREADSWLAVWFSHKEMYSWIVESICICTRLPPHTSCYFSFFLTVPLLRSLLLVSLTHWQSWPHAPWPAMLHASSPISSCSTLMSLHLCVLCCEEENRGLISVQYSWGRFKNKYIILYWIHAHAATVWPWIIHFVFTVLECKGSEREWSEKKSESKSQEAEAVSWCIEAGLIIQVHSLNVPSTGWPDTGSELQC